MHLITTIALKPSALHVYEVELAGVLLTKAECEELLFDSTPSKNLV